jgi:hypothetical protein
MMPRLGSSISEEKLEAAICRRLGIPEPVSRKKGLLGKLFGS